MNGPHASRFRRLRASLLRLHGRWPSVAALAAAIRHESATGLMLGIASAATVALVALVWLKQATVVVALLGGITGGVIAAAVIGAAMPNLLRLFASESQVAAGPVSLAATDMVTLVIYFSLARLLLA